jgi:hypothetical protein
LDVAAEITEQALQKYQTTVVPGDSHSVATSKT